MYVLIFFLNPMVMYNMEELCAEYSSRTQLLHVVHCHRIQEKKEALVGSQFILRVEFPTKG